MATKMAADTTPEEDLKIYRDYFTKRFPGVELQEFSNGVYAIDEVQRANWEAIEEFPPYEPMIDDGEAMWNKPFANGKTYADCFEDGPGIMGKYPYWDKARKEVITLPMAVNGSSSTVPSRAIPRSVALCPFGLLCFAKWSNTGRGRWKRTKPSVVRRAWGSRSSRRTLRRQPRHRSTGCISRRHAPSWRRCCPTWDPI